MSRFFKVRVTTHGRIGHPGAIDRKLVKCVGLKFEDRATNKEWTFRKYDAYGPDWPAMDVWTVSVLLPVNAKDRTRGMAYGPQTPVTVEAVPEEVVAFAIAELVRLRLRGEVRA